MCGLPVSLSERNCIPLVCDCTGCSFIRITPPGCSSEEDNITMLRSIFSVYSLDPHTLRHSLLYTVYNSFIVTYIIEKTSNLIERITLSDCKMFWVSKYIIKVYLWFSNKTKSILQPQDKSPEITHPNINPGSDIGVFGKLPLEMRLKIWTETLSAKGIMAGVYASTMPERALLLAETPKEGEINVAILRTCRAIYEETLPILYNSNWIQFSSESQISHFRSCRLPPSDLTTLSSPPIFGFKSDDYGRLTFLRKVYLELGEDHYRPSRGFGPQNTVHFTPRSTFGQSVWAGWCEFFDPENQCEVITFPQLDSLLLDFRKWNLSDIVYIRVSSPHYSLLSMFVNRSTGYQVDPFLRKLRPKGGLKKLSMVGVYNDSNLRDFKLGFLKNGGKFEVWTQQSATVSIVNHDEIPAASQAVRAFLQERGRF